MSLADGGADAGGAGADGGDAGGGAEGALTLGGGVLTSAEGSLSFPASSYAVTAK